MIDAMRYANEAARKGIVREVKLPDGLTRASDRAPPGFVDKPKDSDELQIPVPKGRHRSQWSY